MVEVTSLLIKSKVHLGSVLESDLRQKMNIKGMSVLKVVSSETSGA